jgi:hypothetical protein
MSLRPTVVAVNQAPPNYPHQPKPPAPTYVCFLLKCDMMVMYAERKK